MLVTMCLFKARDKINNKFLQFFKIPVAYGFILYYSALTVLKGCFVVIEDDLFKVFFAPM